MTVSHETCALNGTSSPILLGVWPHDGLISQARAHYLASVELALMCADHTVMPCGPQVTVILRTLRDCIGASKALGVRASRLMFLLEELDDGADGVIAAAVAVVPAYQRQPVAA